MDNTFLAARITQTQALIIAYEDAVLALTTNGGVESYTIDTGQTRTTVTRTNLKDINKSLESLYNRLCTMQARLTGGGVTIARPCW